MRINIVMLLLNASKHLPSEYVQLVRYNLTEMGHWDAC